MPRKNSIQRQGIKQEVVELNNKQINIILEDDFGRVQTIINSELSEPQLMDKILEVIEND